MKYTFSIKRNIHMYNHLLTVSDEQMCYEAIVESVPLERETMVIWLENFSFPAVSYTHLYATGDIAQILSLDNQTVLNHKNRAVQKYKSIIPKEMCIRDSSFSCSPFFTSRFRKRPMVSPSGT